MAAGSAGRQAVVQPETVTGHPQQTRDVGAEPTPVLITLGAMSLGNGGASEIAGLFVDAVEQAGVRAIIQGWDAALGEASLPRAIHAAGSPPHSWLLPSCAAVVHHGGFGTTAAGFRAGIPALVIPHIADQFFWANIVHESAFHSRQSLQVVVGSAAALAGMETRPT